LTTPNIIEHVLFGILFGFSQTLSAFDSVELAEPKQDERVTFNSSIYDMLFKYIFRAFNLSICQQIKQFD